MAFLAVDGDMFAEKGKAGEAVVESSLVPGPFIVALLAFLSFLPFVRVVFLMTGDAGGGQLLLVQVPFMATGACERGVFALERILGVAIMVERNRLPALFQMTDPTLWPIVALMAIILRMASCAGGRRLVLVERALMTACTARRSVLPLERVFGVAVVVERDRFPVLFRVAAFARGPIVAFVYVVLPVAGDALDGECVLVWVAPVTAFALRLNVLPFEGIFGIPVMVEGEGFPILFRMTTLALLAEPSLVCVVLLVAGGAQGRRLPLRHGHLMTSLAFGPGVFALQRICGVFVMIEGGSLPVPFAVTGCALRPEDPFVVIVLLVTGGAVPRRVLVPFVSMTRLAFGLGMRPAKQEARLTMVETRLFPVPLSMAVDALRPERPLVFVVLFVAIHAQGGGKAIFGAGPVTGCALGLLRVGMGPFEGKIGLSMIERERIEPGYALCASLVFGMALATGSLVFLAPVESLRTFDVEAHVSVALLAEARLGGFVEAFVALRAILLPLGVGLDDLPWHQRGFHVIRRAKRGQCQRDGGHDEAHDVRESIRRMHRVNTCTPRSRERGCSRPGGRSEECERHATGQRGVRRC